MPIERNVQLNRVQRRMACSHPVSSRREIIAAIANAKRAYQTYVTNFEGARFRTLMGQGAAVQRPLWASTGTKNPKYADNPTIRKWRPWVDMQEKYFRNDWIKPILVTEWDDLQKPYLLEVMGSGILVDMVMDAVKGMASPEAAARGQKRVEELLVSAGYLKK